MKYEYYLIYKTTIIRTHVENEEDMPLAEQYVNGKWIGVDYFREVSCRLNGFDPSEDNWMYGIGNTDIMDSIEEISEEEYNALIKEQTCN